MSLVEASSTTLSHPENAKRLTDEEKNTILAKRLSGQQVRQIAIQHGVTEVTVWRICKAVKDSVDAVQNDWRERQVSSAINAVNAGLDDPADSYKRGTLGVQVLKGLGVYAPDQVNQIAVMLSNMPADMRAELEQTTEDKPV